MTPLTYGSVCSGIEGASVAWAPLGWRCAFMAETEAFPRAVLKHHYPEVPLYSDFTQLRDHHREALGEVDVLVGGTPCQGFSVAGLRGSLADDRSNLCLEFIRLANAIDDLRRVSGRPPVWVLWENVPGVFSTADNAFGAFMGGLVGCDAALDPGARLKWSDAGVAAGPDRMAAWRVLDAQHFGLAQRRRRVFVLAVGGAGGWGCADALLPLADSLQGHPAPRRQAREGVARPTAPSLVGSGCGVERIGESRGQDPVVAVAFGGNNTSGEIDLATARNAHSGPHGRIDFESETFVTHALSTAGGDGGGVTEDGTGRGVPLVVADTAPSLTAAGGTEGKHGQGWGQREYETPGFLQVAHSLRADGFDASEDGTGRGTPLIAFTKNDGGSDIGIDIAPTLRAGEFAGSHANAGVMPAIAFSVVPEGGQRADLRASEVDTATALRGEGGGTRTQQGVHVVQPIAFNWQNGGGYGEAHDGLGITEDGTGPLDASTVKAVAIPITSDAMRGEGVALTPSPDAEGRIRLRDPGLGIGDDGDPAGTLQAGGPGAVFTLASRGRGDSHQLEFRDDELANALLTPNGGRGGIGVGAVAYAPDTAATLPARSSRGGGQTNSPGFHADQAVIAQAAAVAFNITPSQGNVDFNARPSDRAQALTGNGNRVSARGGDVVQQTSAVRRLTPTECEKLQGFPPGYTDVPFRGKPAADGPRYKALGNSFATPCVHYIGLRIQETLNG